MHDLSRDELMDLRVELRAELQAAQKRIKELEDYRDGMMNVMQDKISQATEDMLEVREALEAVYDEIG